MIRINLARQKKSSLSSGGSVKISDGGGSGGLSVLLLRIVLPLGIGFASNFALETYFASQREGMEAEIASIEDEKLKATKKLAEVKGFETEKKKLEQTQQFIRTKIETIEKLVQNRDSTAQGLLSLSRAMPRDVWLTEISDSGDAFEIKGSTLDAGLVSDLMVKLQKSVFFQDVQLKNSVSRDQVGSLADFQLGGKHE